jgi:hypothetical protein
MITATVNQLHVPQLCKCVHHQPGVFTCSKQEVRFQSHREMVETLARWTVQQGANACWVYQVVGAQYGL